MKTGQRIKECRKQLGLTLEELAGQMHVSRQTLSRYETGVIANIPWERLEELAAILQTTPGYLMGWNEDTASTETPVAKPEAAELDALAANPVVTEIAAILQSMSTEELLMAKNILLAMKKQP
jgi:transcriptional regulator with XRE-family HTH domain